MLPVSILQAAKHAENPKMYPATCTTEYLHSWEVDEIGRCELHICDHENHWLVPEDDENEMGWVSYEKDKRVLKHTDKDSCPLFQEACSKKRTTA